mmetsp:Transcript_41805/g.50131  ORF Transcript_41805/g.50131 Transcript_41805/m.50131 type:complete len:1006 (-) Transcript_41805:40-3057(-)
MASHGGPGCDKSNKLPSQPPPSFGGAGPPPQVSDGILHIARPLSHSNILSQPPLPYGKPPEQHQIVSEHGNFGGNGRVNKPSHSRYPSSLENSTQNQYGAYRPDYNLSNPSLKGCHSESGKPLFSTTQPTRTKDHKELTRQDRWKEGTRTIVHYQRIEQIGEGTYGQVYRAACRSTHRMVALKKIRVHHGGHAGLPNTIIREIKILKHLRHENMVEMIEVVSSKGVEDFDENDEREDDRRKREQEEKQLSQQQISLLEKRNLNVADAASLSSGNNCSKSSNIIPPSTTVNNSSSKALVVDSRKVSAPKKHRLVDRHESYKGNLFLVLEYVEHDLAGLMDMSYSFTEVQVKCIFKQLLSVLDYMHKNRYVHRDIKCSNILLTSRFQLKLADFGLARSIDDSYRVFDNSSNTGGDSLSYSKAEYTNKVITLWYRPPELLLGETRYDTSVDIWSAGCILAELILGRPLFAGKSDMEQLELIFSVMGSPTEQRWEGHQNLKLLKSGEVKIRGKQSTFKEKMSGKRMATPKALHLLGKLLELDPRRRAEASMAMDSLYFYEKPQPPENPKELGEIKFCNNDSGFSFHEFQTKKRRREAKVVAEERRKVLKSRGKSAREAEKEYDRVYKEYMTQGTFFQQQQHQPRPRGGGSAGSTFSCQKSLTPPHLPSQNDHQQMPNSRSFTSIPDASESERKRKRDSIELDRKKVEREKEKHDRYQEKHDKNAIEGKYKNYDLSARGQNASLSLTSSPTKIIKDAIEKTKLGRSINIVNIAPSAMMKVTSGIGAKDKHLLTTNSLKVEQNDTELLKPHLQVLHGDSKLKHIGCESSEGRDSDFLKAAPQQGPDAENNVRKKESIPQKKSHSIEHKNYETRDKPRKEDEESQQKNVDTLRTDEKRGIIKSEEQNDRKPDREEGERRGKGQIFINRERDFDRRDQSRRRGSDHQRWNGRNDRGDFGRTGHQQPRQAGFDSQQSRWGASREWDRPGGRGIRRENWRRDGHGPPPKGYPGNR